MGTGAGGSAAMSHPRIYAYYFKQWDGFDMPFHRHDSTEIMYVISGECLVETEDESFAMKKGEFIVVGVGVAHRLRVDGTCRMLNVEFGFEAPVGEWPSVIEMTGGEPSLVALLNCPSTHLVLKDPDEVYHALKSLVLELDDRGKRGTPLVSMMMGQLLIRIARLRQEADLGGQKPEERYVKTCLEFLRQNYDRDIRASDAAAAVRLNPGYLQRIFKRSTGKTIVDTLTDIRMEKAKMLLKRTDIPVTDVYEYVGVGSRQYFHALFRKHTGMTPLDYRKSKDAEVWGID
ncbi:helix-turn-helix domain-containing protein [Paenibacillaceae bacterium WGS1546]|uniref:AraC family transcriptional regulator n=1 Tax=Cohnella sp. WGS1546 TaxID=3366810 RepID=UPI00372D67B6